MSVLADIAAAIRLLTVVPVPGWEGKSPLGWFPYVGLAYGGLGWGLAVLSVRVIGTEGMAALLEAAIIVAIWGMLSGFMHWDGLADTADGFGVRGDAARRLAVMRDSTVGAYGVVAIVLVALLETSAIAVLLQHGSAWPIIVAPVFGRLAAAVALVRAPAARPDGLGARYAGGTFKVAVLAALPTLALFAVHPDVAHAVSILLATGIALTTVRFAIRRLGGITGDIAGAVVVGAETAVLIGMALLGVLR